MTINVNLLKEECSRSLLLSLWQRVGAEPPRLLL
uniref:Uncharacterized protein n=1 Tax=Anguilla anguilla TaxID=7936 RepID=A0A0E9QH57_ANGAN